jgi:hypothetical protein
MKVDKEMKLGADLTNLILLKNKSGQENEIS